jgi:hypothetical protein
MVERLESVTRQLGYVGAHFTTAATQQVDIAIAFSAYN